VVLGAPSSAARAVKAATLFERGFAPNPLGWLMPSLGTVDALVPIAAAPPNLREDICGNNRRRQPAEEGEEGGEAGAAAGKADDSGGERSFFLSSLQGPTPKGSAVLTSGLAAAIPPVDVCIGPARVPGAAAASAPAGKKKPEAITTAAKPPAAKPAPAGKPAAKPAPTAVAAPAKPDAPANGLKPWPGGSGDNAAPAKPDPKSKPAVAAVAKPKPQPSPAPAPPQ